MFRLGLYVGFLGVFLLFGIFAMIAGLRSGIESLQATTGKPKKAARRQASLDASSIILIRDNGVTIYGSREDAEASMEWADVERNPSRRAFDAKGIEFVFKRRVANANSTPLRSLWAGANPSMVDLEPKSIIPSPEEFRKALILWLSGKGIHADGGIELEKLILLASRTRYGSPAAIGNEEDSAGSPLRRGAIPDVRRSDGRTDSRTEATTIQTDPREMVAIAGTMGKSGWDENIAIGAVVVIRDNGVTVYDSKEKAEESMEWSDVTRNPSRRAFDLRGIELRFAYHQHSFEDDRVEFAKASFWRRLGWSPQWPDYKPKDVKLVPTSPVAHPDLLREALVQWLEGKGVAVDGGIDLAALIVRASATRNWQGRAHA